MTNEQKKKISESLKKSHAKKKAAKKVEKVEAEIVVRFKKNYGFKYFIGDLVPRDLLIEKQEELKKRNII